MGIKTCKLGGVELLGKLGLDCTCIYLLLVLCLSKQLAIRLFVSGNALRQGRCLRQGQHLTLHRL